MCLAFEKRKKLRGGVIMLFCSNCGKEISPDQKFCHHCSAENRNYSISDSQITVTQTNSYPQAANQVNTLFNRDVLNNYLNNLQTLEFAKHKLSQEEQSLQYRINQLGHPRNIRYKDVDDFTCLGMLVLCLGGFLLGLLLKITGFLKFIGILLMIAAGILAILSIWEWVSDYSESDSKFERETREEENRLKAEKAEKERLSKELPLVKSNLERTTELLDEAYSINIIPAKYRNIYAAYFLYEYISTSTVSLSEALYHCDLDEISQKLDRIIDQQYRMIMELAYSNAMNEEIVHQNEETLRHAIATENNTALAAQYSQVAAVNSGTVAAIQSYHFFNNSL